MSEKDERRYDTGRKTPPEEAEWPRIWRTLDKSEILYQVLYPVVLVAQNWKLMAALIGLAAILNLQDIIGLIGRLAAIGGAIP